jgi:putative hemolysin
MNNNVLIEKDGQAAVCDEAERDIVECVLRLAEWRVDAVMMPRAEVVCLDLDDSPEATQRRIVESRDSVLPVCDGGLDRIIGVANAKQLLTHCLTGDAIDLEAFAHTPLIVPGSLPALRLLHLFEQTGLEAALVLDDSGDAQGIVTHTGLLEIIVGEIAGGQPI